MKAIEGQDSHRRSTLRYYQRLGRSRLGVAKSTTGKCVKNAQFYNTHSLGMPLMMKEEVPQKAMNTRMSNKNVLWLRWTIANALSEAVGLGTTFTTIGLLTAKIEDRQTMGILLSFAIAVSCGAIEATIVGLAQWWAMHPWFPTIRRLAWWRATSIGALVGYILGYIPSTLMSIGEVATQTPTAEPPQWVTLILAAGLGAVAGAVLSFAQWRVLRRKVERAGLWIPANMLAWAFGMPVIFWGMDVAFTMSAVWQSVLVIGVALLAAGVIVGIIHGRCLMILAGEN
ncbi:hypothetical protein [Chamaesiphon polymorphus]|uniref:Uncharacterized protein n=1 Tax=Chamaesiphon polymorphus CCALA 037 TaxID=2107692 RepID=A0A2T1GCN5_9CYAN|nr:hypothetical protein [Chamaesiphon polymorphus]PSB55185.1 hypothetical protein C7B77_15845 [Chamaesiphon polymorphus CCALA 037]